jgi:hypothetical protein
MTPVKSPEFWIRKTGLEPTHAALDEMTSLGGGSDKQLAEAMRLATAIL